MFSAPWDPAWIPRQFVDDVFSGWRAQVHWLLSAPLQRLYIFTTATGMDRRGSLSSDEMLFSKLLWPERRAAGDRLEKQQLELSRMNIFPSSRIRAQ